MTVIQLHELAGSGTLLGDATGDDLVGSVGDIGLGDRSRGAELVVHSNAILVGGSLRRSGGRAIAIMVLCTEHIVDKSVGLLVDMVLFLDRTCGYGFLWLAIGGRWSRALVGGERSRGSGHTHLGSLLADSAHLCRNAGGGNVRTWTMSTDLIDPACEEVVVRMKA